MLSIHAALADAAAIAEGVAVTRAACLPIMVSKATPAPSWDASVLTCTNQPLGEHRQHMRMVLLTILGSFSLL